MKKISFTLMLDLDQRHPNFSSIYEQTGEFIKKLGADESIEYEFGNIYSKVYGVITPDNLREYLKILDKYKIKGLRFTGRHREDENELYTDVEAI